MTIKRITSAVLALCLALSLCVGARAAGSSAKQEALQALGELTGQSVREDVTDRIFSKFCVGK